MPLTAHVRENKNLDSCWEQDPSRLAILRRPSESAAVTGVLVRVPPPLIWRCKSRRISQGKMPVEGSENKWIVDAERKVQEEMWRFGIALLSLATLRLQRDVLFEAAAKLFGEGPNGVFEL